MFIPIIPTTALVGFAAVAARFGLRQQWQNAVICLLCGGMAFLFIHRLTSRPPSIEKERRRIDALEKKVPTLEVQMQNLRQQNNSNSCRTIAEEYMSISNTLGTGLAGLPFLGAGRTRSVSAENPTGEKGKGGMAIPDPSAPNRPAGAAAADDLGQGWKVSPFLRIGAGETATLMDVKGPGIIQHMWLVEDEAAKDMNRAMVIRLYWDGEDEPSVECPALEFFAVGHGCIGKVNSLPVVVNPRNSLNCFWPMPFRKRAKVTLTNEGIKDNCLVAYQITYVESAVPENAGCFHAQYRQGATADQNPYTILDGIEGQGRYVGTFIAWTQMERGWFGEGEVKFYMDGDESFPTICGTGTEDYFLASFGFPEDYTTAYAGSVLPADENAAPPQYWSLYRWHIQDPVNFDKDLRVTIQALGWGRKYRVLKKDRIASVAYWYQNEPHSSYPVLPTLEQRIPQ